jgi:hypothetical protein
METLLIAIKSKKDKLLFSALAGRLGLRVRFLSRADQEDYGLLKAMLKMRKTDYVNKDKVLKALRK